MKKVKRRATATLLIACLIFVGLAVYLVRLADHGGDWATYFSGSTPAGTITDRNGVTLYSSDGAGSASFAEDWATRIACYHAVGDSNASVGTGALRQFRDKLSGYNFVTGASGGRTLELTIDSALNVTAYSALAGRNGCVMLMDYTTGEVLCMTSSPADDPANPSSAPADGTYLNKCLSSTFVPGSIYKLVTLCAALETIPDLYERTFWCQGSVDVGGLSLKCTASHGTQTIEQALSNSCNCAFSAIAQELGADKLAEYAEKLGVTTPHELSGIATAAGSFDKAESGSIDLSWSGIGQYHDMINPYSYLRYIAAIANGGTLIEPTLTGTSVLQKKTELLSAGTAGKISDMMGYNVVNAYGEWSFPGLKVHGKTGTAETGDGYSHAWFAGFLEDEAHPYAFIVLVEKGGGGLKAAGAVANTVLQSAVAG